MPDPRFINDKIGEEKMPVEGTEAPRSFLDGTGKRKYDKNDSSVVIMRKNRAKTYRLHGVGIPGQGALALTKREMISRGILNKDGNPSNRHSRKIDTSKKPTINLANELFMQAEQKRLSEKMSIQHAREKEELAKRLRNRKQTR